MRNKFLAIWLFATAFPAVAAENDGRHYRVVDEDGVPYYGDSVPQEYTDLDKDVINDHGVKIGEIEGRKSAEELEAERIAAEARAMQEKRKREDMALLATYQTVQEILMHRDRRVELFQAQSRVTELYLRNLQRQLDKFEREASHYAPYSSAEDAEMIDPELVSAIKETKDTIARHKLNLQKFRDEEQVIIARFDGDITRFKSLKGID
jgi:hypothetical protein